MRDPSILDSFERSALALSSSLERGEVLRALAGLTLESFGGSRCSIFLLEGHTLVPVATTGIPSDEELWMAFREMGAIDLDAIPMAWDHLSAGRVVTIDDARTTQLIPEIWRERFSLRAVALVPLLADGLPCGVLALDHPQPQRFGSDDLRELEAIGSCAGVAIRNARLFEQTRRRARTQQVLAEAAATLVSSPDVRETLERLADAFDELLEARMCAIGLVDESYQTISTLVSRGVDGLAASIDVADLPQDLVSLVSGRWSIAPGPVNLDLSQTLEAVLGHTNHEMDRCVLIPILIGDRPRGAVLVGVGEGSELAGEEMAAAGALAAIASAALEKSQLNATMKRHLRRMEILHGLGATLAQRTSASALAERLNGLLADEGFNVESIALRNRQLRKHLGGDRLTRDERIAFQDGRTDVAPDGIDSFPMMLGRNLVGAMRVRSAALAPEDRSFLQALAHGVAEVAHREALRAEVEEADRERAVMGERSRIAADLQDTAGQLLVSIWLLARRAAEELPGDSAWAPRFTQLAELANRSKWEMDQAVDALAAFPAGGRGLLSSMRSLAETFGRDSGIEVVVDTSGRPYRLSPQTERALYRAFHESLISSWRDGRSSVVRAELDYFPDRIVLRVTDDGLGLTRRVGRDISRPGSAAMRQGIVDLGGTIKARNSSPAGLVIEAVVPGDAP